MLPKVASIIATLLFAIVLIGAGLGVCCLPATTEVLARLYSGMDNPTTPFNHEALIKAAQATRDYTVGSHDADTLIAILREINGGEEASEIEGTDGTNEIGDVDTANKIDTATEAGRSSDANDETTSTGNAGWTDDERRTLLPDALSHLDDVNSLIIHVRALMILFLGVGIALTIYAGSRLGRTAVGRILKSAGACVLILFAFLLLWAILDFEGIFTTLHTVFFAQGNWTFDETSLLITMYPTAFWMGMGIVWLLSTVIFSILCMVVGNVLSRH